MAFVRKLLDVALQIPASVKFRITCVQDLHEDLTSTGIRNSRPNVRRRGAPRRVTAFDAAPKLAPEVQISLVRRQYQPILKG